MDMSRIVDCHTHSRRSFDGSVPVRWLAEEASRVGLGGVAVTDHCEINAQGRQKLWSYRGLKKSVRDIRRAQAKGLNVLCGVELGQPTYHPESARRVLANADYDIVLGSIHYLRDGRDFYYLKYTDGSCDPAEIYDRYLDEVLLMAEQSDFDSLAHLTYPLRYIQGRDRVQLDMTRYEDKYDRILTVLAQRGKALEINTSGARRENGFMLPDVHLVRRFRELGGRYITLGSDTHRQEHFAAGLAQGAGEALAAGFTEAVYYKKRRPVSYPLVSQQY